MSGQRRVTFTIPILTSGGAERVLTTMANYWAMHGSAVTVVTLSGPDDRPFYDLNPDVFHVACGGLASARTPVHALVNNGKRLAALRSAIAQSKPDVVISFLDHMNVLTLVATRGLGLPVIVSEHTDPNLAHHHPVWNRLRAQLYPQAERVVVLSESSKQFFSPRIQDRIQIIPNPIVVSPPARPLPVQRRLCVAALGRFGPEKGFDTLIAAFADIANDFPDWDLVIWGDGVLRPDLESQRDELELSTRILMPGRTSTPHDDLRTANLYVLSSRREGFPMALAEAMACGLPAIAFDLPSGPKDIIRDGVDGVLVPNQDTAALSRAMADLMGDPARRDAMAANAPEVLERFGVDRVMAIWETLIEQVVGS